MRSTPDNLNFPYAGSGWAFPVAWNHHAIDEADPLVVETRADSAAGVDKVKQSMELIVRTEIGERRMRPRFGSSANDFVFESATDAGVSQLGYFTERAIKLFEPRVIVDRVETVTGSSEGRVDIVIEFRMDRHRRPTSLVVPFYPDPTSGDALNPVGGLQ